MAESGQIQNIRLLRSNQTISPIFRIDQNRRSRNQWKRPASEETMQTFITWLKNPSGRVYQIAKVVLSDRSADTSDTSDRVVTIRLQLQGRSFCFLFVFAGSGAHAPFRLFLVVRVLIPRIPGNLHRIHQICKSRKKKALVILISVPEAVFMLLSIASVVPSCHTRGS